MIGIGGVFLKSAEADKLHAWYQERLGVQDHFRWRSHDNSEVEHLTAWSVFPAESTYFAPSPATFMVNYIVDDLDAILAKLSASGVRIDPKREDYEYGRFAWIFDPDGNKIELWEPPRGSA